MKKILSILFLFALLVSSCSEEELVKGQSSVSDSLKFTASFEGDKSRTYVEEGNLLRWTAGDQISLFVGNTLNRQYQFDGETGEDTGTFSIVDNPFGTGNKLDCHYAVYPYDSKIKISDDTNRSIRITATLPAVQSYAENSFGPGANTMVAVTKDTQDTYLKFRNVCGYLKLQLYGDDVIVRSLTLRGNAGERIAGKAVITPSYDGDPTVNMAGDATDSITLDCGENGIKIGTTAEEATAFWLVVPPKTFIDGFTVIVTDMRGDERILSTYKTISVERNVITPMSAFDIEYNAFVSLGMGTFQDNWAMGGTYSVEIQKAKGYGRYRVIDPYKEGLTNDDGEWDNWIAMGTRCPYIEFWETGEGDLVMFNTFALGVNYQAAVSQPIKAYHASKFDGCVPTFSKKIDDKTYQLAPYYYIDGLGGWNYTEYDDVIVITLP